MRQTIILDEDDIKKAVISYIEEKMDHHMPDVAFSYEKDAKSGDVRLVASTTHTIREKISQGKD